MAFEYEIRKAGYRNLWNQAELRPEKRAVAIDVAEYLLGRRARYQAIEKETGVPWWWIAATHYREAGRDENWQAVLHNGQKIVGTRRKTTIVPKGRGPFATFEAAAIDALNYMQLSHLDDWGIERASWASEKFNGTGYARRGINSPYLYSATSLQMPGKYISDGKFSASTWDTQLGVVAIWKAMAELDSAVADAMDGVSAGHGGEDASEDVIDAAPMTLADYSVEQLYLELISRRGVTSVKINISKP